MVAQGRLRLRMLVVRGMDGWLRRGGGLLIEGLMRSVPVGSVCRSWCCVWQGEMVSFMESCLEISLVHVRAAGGNKTQSISSHF